MTYDPSTNHRRSIRLRGYDYSRAGAYFITTCVQNREHVFGEINNGRMILNPWGEIIQRVWADLPNHYDHIVLDEYVVMPNHFHGIVMITGGVGAIHALPLHQLPQREPCQHGSIHELPLRMPQQSLHPQSQKSRRNMVLFKIMGRFKMVSSKHINTLRKTSGFLLWQRNYWEHVVRDDDDLDHIRHYIRYNPTLWDLDVLNDNAGNKFMETQTTSCGATP